MRPPPSDESPPRAAAHAALGLSASLLPAPSSPLISTSPRRARRPSTPPSPTMSPPRAPKSPTSLSFSIPPPASPASRTRLGRAEAAPLFAPLADQPYTSATLGGCTIGPGGANAVAEHLRALASRGSLRTLSIADVVATLPEKEAVRTLSTLATAAAAAAPTIISLDLSYNALGSKGVSACAPLFQALAPRLAHLYLKRAGLGPDSARLLRTFLVSSQSATALRTLHVTSSVLTSPGVGHVAAVLEKSPLIEDVRLSSLRAGADAIATVFVALAGHATQLRSLDLSDNDMSVDSALGFGHVLDANPQLSHLTLRDMAMGNDAAYLVLRAVTKCKVAVSHLDLAGNELTADSSDAFAACFEAKGAALVNLDLSDNPFGDDAAIRIARSLTGDAITGLSVVGLASCELNDLGVVSIADSLRALPSLTKLDLSGANVKAATVNAVHAALGDKVVLPQDSADESLFAHSAEDASSSGTVDYERELAAALVSLSGLASRKSRADDETAPLDGVTSESALSTTSNRSFWSRFGAETRGEEIPPTAETAVEPTMVSSPEPATLPRTPPTFRLESGSATRSGRESSQKSASMVSSARQLRAQVVTLDREVGELMQELQPTDPAAGSSMMSGAGTYYSATSRLYLTALQREEKDDRAQLLDFFWASVITLFFVFVVLGIVQSQDEMTFSLRPV